MIGIYLLTKTDEKLSKENAVRLPSFIPLNTIYEVNYFYFIIGIQRF